MPESFVAATGRSPARLSATVHAGGTLQGDRVAGRQQAAAELKAFISESVSKRSMPDVPKEQEQRRKELEVRTWLDVIDYQFNWFVNVRKVAEDRKGAMRLDKSASRYLRDLSRAEPFWSFMSFKAPEKSLGLENPPVKYFDRDSWLPEHSDAVLYAGLVRSAAKAMAEALKQGTRQADLPRRLLGQSLAGAFSQLKGQPTHSNEATFENPLTEFGSFVRLAILASPHAGHPRVQKVKDAFASFVREAADNFAGRTKGKKPTKINLVSP